MEKVENNMVIPIYKKRWFWLCLYIPAISLSVFQTIASANDLGLHSAFTIAFGAGFYRMLVGSMTGSVAGLITGYVYLSVFFLGFFITIKSKIIDRPLYSGLGISLYALGWILFLFLLYPGID